ARAPHQARLP
ncbi:hypothetical protein BN1708_020566, partial [Verticillium longisporum]